MNMSAKKLSAAFLALMLMENPSGLAADSVERDLKVAFLGDQGLKSESKAVMRLIKDENADMVLQLGDFDYKDDPSAFKAQIDRILGPEFPFFAVMGNHDRKAWQQYQQNFKARLTRLKGAKCEGDLGVKSACTFKGLFFILSAIGTVNKHGGNHPRDVEIEKSHIAYIENKLAQSQEIWRICLWHKVQRAMQMGDKRDETGWGVYEACRKGGAIIATGHEHSYSRTHLIGEFKEQPIIASKDKILRLEQGKTFAVVSGLGGMSVRPMRNIWPFTHRYFNHRYLSFWPFTSWPFKLADPWWAAYYTRDQKAQAGALFCTFNPQGREREADCYFKDINGMVSDRFKVISTLGG